MKKKKLTWSKDNHSKKERKTLFELQSDTSVVVLPAEKINLTLFIIVRTIWENVWMMWTMTHINYLKIDPTNKIKAKALKDNKFINKLYYFVSSIFFHGSLPNLLISYAIIKMQEKVILTKKLNIKRHMHELLLPTNR